MAKFIETVKAVEKLMGKRMSKEDVGIGLSVLDDAYPGYLDDVMVFLNGSASKDRKRFNISHDIYGMKGRDKGFLPRLTGYAKRAAS